MYRAERNFQRALQLEPATYRARLGLADVALRSGKLAHVINQYRDAAVATSEKSLVAFANREADYYFSLNDDDDYLSSELRRINWLQTLSHMRRVAARITNASILIALLGPYLNSTIEGMGWALASSRSWPGYWTFWKPPACDSPPAFPYRLAQKKRTGTNPCPSLISIQPVMRFL